VGPILSVLFPMCAESDADSANDDSSSSNNNNNSSSSAVDDGLDDDEYQLTAHKFASQMFDFLAITLPTKLVFMPAMEYIVRYVQIDSLHRRAAITILAVMAEGCAELMKDRLDVVLPCVSKFYTLILLSHNKYY